MYENGWYLYSCMPVLLIPNCHLLHGTSTVSGFSKTQQKEVIVQHIFNEPEYI